MAGVNEFPVSGRLMVAKLKLPPLGIPASSGAGGCQEPLLSLQDQNSCSRLDCGSEFAYSRSKLRAVAFVSSPPVNGWACRWTRKCRAPRADSPTPISFETRAFSGGFQQGSQRDSFSIPTGRADRLPVSPAASGPVRRMSYSLLKSHTDYALPPAQAVGFRAVPAVNPKTLTPEATSFIIVPPHPWNRPVCTGACAFSAASSTVFRDVSETVFASTPSAMNPRSGGPTFSGSTRNAS